MQNNSNVVLKYGQNMRSGNSIRSASGSKPILDRRAKRDLKTLPDNQDQSLDNVSPTEKSFNTINVRSKPSLNKAMGRKISVSKRSDWEP